MSAPLPVTLETRELPFERPVIVRARITDPPAIDSGNYFGWGRAYGRRLEYRDAQEFVWWASDELLGVGAAFSSAFSSAFEGGVGSPTGSGFSVAFSSAFR